MFSSFDYGKNSCLEHANICPYLNLLKRPQSSLPKWPPADTSDCIRENVDLMERMLPTKKPSDTPDSLGDNLDLIKRLLSQKQNTSDSKRENVDLMERMLPTKRPSDTPDSLGDDLDLIKRLLSKKQNTSDSIRENVDLMERLLSTKKPTDQKSSFEPLSEPLPYLPDFSKISYSEVLFRMDTKHFLPTEVSVKVIEDKVVIHGKHPDFMDEHGLVAREFTRRAKIPEDFDKETVTATFDHNGILSVSANKIVDPKKEGKRIPLKLVRSAFDNY